MTFKLKVMNKKGQTSGILGLIVAIILVVGVSIPVATDVIASANLTGLSATLVGFIPVFLAIGGLVLAANVAK